MPPRGPTRIKTLPQTRPPAYDPTYDPSQEIRHAVPRTWSGETGARLGSLLVGKPAAEASRADWLAGVLGALPLDQLAVAAKGGAALAPLLFGTVRAADPYAAWHEQGARELWPKFMKALDRLPDINLYAGRQAIPRAHARFLPPKELMQPGLEKSFVKQAPYPGPVGPGGAIELGLNRPAPGYVSRELTLPGEPRVPRPAGEPTPSNTFLSLLHEGTHGLYAPRSRIAAPPPYAVPDETAWAYVDEAVKQGLISPARLAHYRETSQPHHAMLDAMAARLHANPEASPATVKHWYEEAERPPLPQQMYDRPPGKLTPAQEARYEQLWREERDRLIAARDPAAKKTWRDIFRLEDAASKRRLQRELGRVP
jgi:hypothetical protein